MVLIELTKGSIFGRVNFKLTQGLIPIGSGYMPSLVAELEKYRQTNGLTNAQMWSALGLDPGLGSRITSGTKGVSYGLMSRFLIKLSSAEARAFLQAYFEDELERIRLGREEKAAELGVKLQEPDWPHGVKIVAKTTLKRTR